MWSWVLFVTCGLSRTHISVASGLAGREDGGESPACVPDLGCVFVCPEEDMTHGCAASSLAAPAEGHSCAWARGILGRCLTAAPAAAWVFSHTPHVVPLSGSPEWGRASRVSRALSRPHDSDPHPEVAPTWFQQVDRYPVLATRLRGRSNLMAKHSESNLF